MNLTNKREKASYSSIPDLERDHSFHSYCSEISSASSMTADHTTVLLSSLKPIKDRDMDALLYVPPHATLRALLLMAASGGMERSLRLVELCGYRDSASMVHPRLPIAEDGMKKRQGKVSEETAEYTETRAIMLELRLGFLSMQYGILLRWDARSGKIVLVIRCTKDVTSAASGDPKYDREPCHIHRLGTEVVLIYPRFLISPKSLLLLYCLSRSTTLLIFQERVGGLSP
jgi:hypothetical protein